MEMITYLLKVNLYWMLFYGWYWLFLRRHTFFRLNRFFLITSLIAALLLPIIQFPEKMLFAPPMIANYTSHHLQEASNQNADNPGNWAALAIALYAAVGCYLLFKLLIGIYNLSLLIRKGERLKFDNYTLVLLPESSSERATAGSFSFFRWLVVSSRDYDQNLDTIINHEVVHIRQFHSFDILLIEVIKMLFWFNPVVWFYKSAIREVHEFLADEQAENRDHYAAFLVSYAQKNSLSFLTNQFFNASMLKDRVRMLYRKRTSQRSLYQYLMVVPAVALAVFLTAARPTIVQIEGESDEKSTTVSKEKTALPKLIPKTNHPQDSKIILPQSINKTKAQNRIENLSNREKKLTQLANIRIEEAQDREGGNQKRYFTNYNQKQIKVELPNMFFPTLSNVRKTVANAWKNKPPKTHLDSVSYQMLTYPNHSVKIDTIFFP